MKDIQLYKPIGPLKYLVMDKNGNSLIGLYLQTNKSKLVIIYNSFLGSIVIEPNTENLILFMQNKLTIKRLIKKSTLKNIDATKVTPVKKLFLYLLSNLKLSNTIENLKAVDILPNYYYTFYNYLENEKIK